MEQGLKVFNGIYKRIYRAMSAEFQLLFEVNWEHLDLNKYMMLLDDQGLEVKAAMEQAGESAVLQFLSGDFKSDGMDIIPTAEPDMVAEVQKAQRAESLMMKIQAGLPLNPMAVTRRMLEAERHDNIEELLDLPEPPPDPQVEIDQKKLELDAMRLQIEAATAEADVTLKETQAEVLMLESESKGVERLHAQFISEKKQTKEEFDSITNRLKEMTNARKTEQAGKKTAGTTGTNK